MLGRVASSSKHRPKKSSSNIAGSEIRQDNIFQGTKFTIIHFQNSGPKSHGKFNISDVGGQINSVYGRSRISNIRKSKVQTIFNVILLVRN